MTDLVKLIRDVPDFPKPGVVFKDITPILSDGKAFDDSIRALAAYTRKRRADVVAGIEARGFVFGAAVAANLGIGFVPVRKAGKLPWKTVRETYKLEYGEDAVEVHEDAIRKGQNVVIVDDVLATGGTMAATCRLIERIGGVVAGTACLIELSFLEGRKKIAGHDFHTLITL